MSKLDELINKLCPTGVEYKSLEEISIDIFRGAGIKRDQITDDGIPCVRYGEIYTSYGLWFENCVSHTIIENVQAPKWFQHGDILFAVTGESIEDIAKSTAYLGNERCLAGGDIIVLRHNQNPKYLSYALSTTRLRKQKSSGKVKSKVVHASLASIKELIVPVPPMEIQDAIVQILDKYEDSKAKLINELRTELQLREKQYEHYKDMLFEFDEA